MARIITRCSTDRTVMRGNGSTGLAFDGNVTNACKGVATLMLLWHHLAPHCVHSGPVVEMVGAYGKICVSIFVMLSGFGLMRSNRQGVGGQVFRILRLYSNYWIVAAVFIALSWLFFGRSVYVIFPDNRTWIHVAAELLGLHTFCGINPTWWFVKTILILYLLYPVLSWLMSRQWVYPVIISIVSLFLLNQNPGIWIIPFTLGMLLAKYNVFETCKDSKLCSFVIVPLSLLLLLVVRYFSNFHIAGGRLEDVLIAALICHCVFVISARGALIIRILRGGGQA